MFKIIGDNIYFKNVCIATFNKLTPSFREIVEDALNNDFYSKEEIAQIGANAISSYGRFHLTK